MEARATGAKRRTLMFMIIIIIIIIIIMIIIIAALRATQLVVQSLTDAHPHTGAADVTENQ